MKSSEAPGFGRPQDFRINRDADDPTTTPEDPGDYEQYGGSDPRETGTTFGI